MTSKVLELLKINMPDYISGEEISNTLGVSRTAIWKHIKSLRQEGYVIDSLPKVGYRLISAPDRLLPAEIQEAIDTQVIGSSVIYFEKIDSTNQVAKQLALAGAPEGTVVVAEQQTGGRGRLGRGWHSPTGKGIWISIILRPRINPMDAPKITILTAVALARAVERISKIRPEIKWPNDLLIEGKKISGVLTEMNAEMECINYVVIGIGVNINNELGDMPEELHNIATSLHLETGKTWSRLDLLAQLLRELEDLYLVLSRGDFLPVISEWKDYSVTLDKKVRIVNQGDYIAGRAVDLDADGALVLETPDGTRKKILAGEVMIEN